MLLLDFRIQDYIQPVVRDEQGPEATIPQILLKLENVTAEEGCMAKFMTKITGYPKPRVCWTVNGIPAITVNNRMKLSFYFFKKTIHLNKIK